MKISYSFDCEDRTTGGLLFNLLKTLKIEQPIFLQLFRSMNPIHFSKMLKETQKSVREFKKREDTFLFLLDRFIFCEEARLAFMDIGCFPTEVTVAAASEDFDINGISMLDFDVEKDESRFDFSIFSWSEGMILDFKNVYFDECHVKERIEEWEKTFMFKYKKTGHYEKNH